MSELETISLHEAMGYPNVSVKTPLITMEEAMAYFYIKDLETWRQFRRDNKIPFCQVGKQKLFHTDELNKIALKLSKESLRTYEN
jgi:hypothetical protein